MTRSIRIHEFGDADVLGIENVGVAPHAAPQPNVPAERSWAYAWVIVPIDGPATATAQRRRLHRWRNP